MKKVVSVLLIIVAAIAVFSAVAYNDYNAAVSVSDDKFYQITVKDYATGDSVSLTESKAQSEILKEIENIKFVGFRSSNAPITPEDSAYSVTVSADDYLCIFTVAKNKKQNYIIANKFRYSIKASDSLYLAVQSEMLKKMDYSIAVM